MRQMNLIPQEIVVKAEQQKSRVSLMVTVAATLVVIGGVYLALAGSLSHARASLRTLQAQMPQETEVRPEDQLQQAEREIGALYASHQEIGPFLMSQEAYINLLKAITQAVEGRVKLKTLAVDLEHGECLMSGSASSQEIVSEFVVALKALPFFAQVELTSLEQARGDEGSSVSAQFETRCTLAMQ